MGHIPRVISAICTIFIQRGGIILCTVNGSRCYSSGLPQGGLEIPCILTLLTSQATLRGKTRKLVKEALSVKSNITNTIHYKMVANPQNPSLVKIQSNDAENDAGYCNSPLPLIDLTVSGDDASHLRTEVS